VKSLKRLIAMSALVVAVGALMASPAFASGVKWNATGGFTMKGSLTLKKAGESAVTCNLSSSAAAFNEENKATFATTSYPVKTVCTNGESFWWGAQGSVQYTGSEYLFNYFGTSGLPLAAPWKERTWTGGAVPTFNNGSGATASHIDFSETKIGSTNKGEAITATGKIEMYRSGGALLTVSAF
jgi:hypothetical protein